MSIARNTIRVLIFSVALIPAFMLLWNVITSNLGANPIEGITHFTGDWALYFLLLTLAITPLRYLTRNRVSLARFRRMLGLFCFFYAVLHVLTYIVLDQFFDLPMILKDIIKRPYITVGASAFIFLVPLAVTSTNRMMRRLGKNWRRLHRAIYLIAPLVVLHFFWSVKADIRKSVILGAILGGLFLIRLTYRYLTTTRTASSRLLNEKAQPMVIGAGEKQG